MYGQVPSYCKRKPSSFTIADEDLAIAFANIVERGERFAVSTKNTDYAVDQMVTVQLNSRARDAASREFYSVGKILSRGPEEHQVRVRYMNTNVHRPEGMEEVIHVKHLVPLKSQVDFLASMTLGNWVTKSHPEYNTRDSVLYIEEFYLKRILDTPNAKNDTQLLIRYSGDAIRQSSWVSVSRISDNQLSHVENLVGYYNILFLRFRWLVTYRWYLFGLALTK